MKIGVSEFSFKDPVVMGILNITPDSVSDGGKFISRNAALEHAMQLIEEGADILDVGGESSRPGSDPVSAEEEMERIVPVVSAIRSVSNIPISVDTTKARVAEEALKAGANMLNDISAGTIDSEMFRVAASNSGPICLMHMRGTPKTMQTGEIFYADCVAEIANYLEERASAACAAGVKRENIVIDPGICFGKRVEDNISILKGVGRLKSLGYPILIGASRKSFIGTILGDVSPQERLEGSLATAAIAVQNGANIIRVHDVMATRRFLKVYRTLV